MIIWHPPIMSSSWCKYITNINLLWFSYWDPPNLSAIIVLYGCYFHTFFLAISTSAFTAPPNSCWPNTHSLNIKFFLACWGPEHRVPWTSCQGSPPRQPLPPTSSCPDHDNLTLALAHCGQPSGCPHFTLPDDVLAGFKLSNLGSNLPHLHVLLHQLAGDSAVHHVIGHPQPHSMRTWIVIILLIFIK